MTTPGHREFSPHLIQQQCWSKPGLGWFKRHMQSKCTQCTEEMLGIGWFCSSASVPWEHVAGTLYKAKANCMKSSMASEQTSAKHTAPLILQTGINGVCLWSLATGMSGSTLCLLLWGEAADLPKLLDESLKPLIPIEREVAGQTDSMQWFFTYFNYKQHKFLMPYKYWPRKKRTQTPSVLLPLNQLLCPLS